ncbi:hypothetical protein [Aquisalibacillus elongatus]|uniref:Uncharacterized protein n=1 Tax=Aquisalibacillus elongatus TaxID=485577 RepID=A0A3N5B968_9BACI|nr:hypothetical protein [Aquisalibacillus elongatus]RPF53933.1 hypothetical protein EDC24_1118 [Aquisalibacillus elongatus]
MKCQINAMLLAVFVIVYLQIFSYLSGLTAFESYVGGFWNGTIGLSVAIGLAVWTRNRIVKGRACRIPSSKLVQ